jgi:photosystem II stability/assembly factor-like uncharacterized protein
MRLLKLTFLVLIALTFVSQNLRADWHKLSINSAAWYKDITFVTKDRGWIVGTDGTMLSTDNGGETWQPIRKFTSDNILQVKFTDEFTGWILCERNIYERGTNPISYLRKTTDGGLKWERVEFPNIGRERMIRLLFGTDGRAIAFGEGGIFYRLQDDGVTWKRTKLGIHFLLLDGSYGSDTVGAIVGAGGTIMFTDDGGFTWEKATLIGDTDTRLNAISFGGPKGGWAVGTNGHIFRSTGNGRLWRQMPQVTDSNLNDVFFTSSSSGWVVGDDGTILRTRDGGNSWAQMNSRVTHRLERIVFHGNKGFAVGHGGTILVYSDNVTSPDPRAKPTLQKRS